MKLVRKYILPQKKVKQLLSESSEHQKMFESWHISTPTGSAPRSLKKILKKFWNGKEFEMVNVIYSEIVTQFELEFETWGEGNQWPNDDFLGFKSLNSQKDMMLKASRKKGFSLQDLAAAAVSLELEHIDDIGSLIVNGCIPATLENILIKYI